MSAFHPKATEQRTQFHVGFVPLTDVFSRAAPSSSNVAAGSRSPSKRPSSESRATIEFTCTTSLKADPRCSNLIREVRQSIIRGQPMEALQSFPLNAWYAAAWSHEVGKRELLA